METASSEQMTTLLQEALSISDAGVVFLPGEKRPVLEKKARGSRFPINEAPQARCTRSAGKGGSFFMPLSSRSISMER